MKKCKKCGAERPLAEFGKHRETADKLYPWCKPCAAEYQRAKRAEYCPEARRKKNADWRKQNPERLRVLRQRAIEKKKSTPQGRLTLSVRSYLSQNLAQRGAVKRSKTFEALGYSPDDLVCHIEELFQPGMTWENYGHWHLDHIRPLASFVYESTDCEQFREAWALSNLQPLWAEDNLSKGAKVA